MPDAKKVTVEITVPRAIIPQSVYENDPKKRHVGRIVDLGETVEVYEDVAEKLEKNFQASRVTKDSPASIKETLEAKEEEERVRRETLITGGSEEEKPKKKK